MTRRPLAAALLLLAGCVHTSDPQDRLMQAIEAAVLLPPGSSSISSYRRHYAWSKDQPGLVEAVYVKGGQADRVWLNADELPIVLDGGCGVVTFNYNVASRRAQSVRCN